jgi:CheY-like chemotaxis protein
VFALKDLSYQNLSFENTFSGAIILAIFQSAHVVIQKMSRFELCRYLKINPGIQKLPIVICSSKNPKLSVFGK